MKKIFLSFTILALFITTGLLMPLHAHAATFRGGETVTVNTSLEDLYVSGGTVSIKAPTLNDLTVAGGTVNILSPVSNSVLAAGGTLNINGAIGNTLRAAGGTIHVTSPIKKDAVLFGGTILIDETASLSGDLIVTGGTINVQAPVAGDIYVNGGQVTLNASVSGNVEGEVGTLILGNNAVINGNLSYSSEERATLRDGAILKGQENFNKVERNDHDEEKIAGVITSFTFYKLITDILASLALVYMFYAFSKRAISQAASDPLRHGLLGLGTLILGPVIGFCLLVILLPGVIALIFYGLLLLLNIYVSKLLAGWLLLRWWYARQGNEYELDWKAAIIGPLSMFVLLLIPILGWFLGFLLYLVALGGIVGLFFKSISGTKEHRVVRNHTEPAKAVPARRTPPRKKKS